ncbi:MAG: heavy-metal-associated domain-containing protein [Sporomusaceae bacterium]|nr:heavy-metal-associated domain-containing protein [Sporomusaceae bacterium]
MGNNIERYTMIVEGMSCGHCKNAVEKAVGALPGLLSAEVDLAAKSLMVEFDASKTTLSEIKDAVVEEGYTVVE